MQSMLGSIFKTLLFTVMTYLALMPVALAVPSNETGTIATNFFAEVDKGKMKDPASLIPYLMVLEDEEEKNNLISAAQSSSRTKQLADMIPSDLFALAKLKERLLLSSDEIEQLYQLYAFTVVRSGLPTTATQNQSGPQFSPLELLSLIHYTGTDYSPVSDELKATEGEPERYVAFTETLDSALNLLPNYQGTVIHKQFTAPDKLAKLHTGTIMLSYDYLSCSKSDVGWPGNVKLVIKSKTGKDVQTFSANPQEEEVLLPRGSRLRIVKEPVTDSAGQTTIEADQI